MPQKEATMSLTKDDILQADDIAIRKVAVPEWAKDGNKETAFVFVKSMSGTERDAFEAAISQVRGGVENFRAKLAAFTICDEQGNLLFSQKDIAALGKKSSAALQRVFNAASRLSKISNQDVEELTENLEKNPSDGSASD